VWKVGIAGGQWRQQQTFSLYVDDDGGLFGKSAQRLWDELAAGRVAIDLAGETGSYDFPALERLAEAEAAELYEGLLNKTRTRARRRQDALSLSYLARRSALLNIQAEEVRLARRKDLEEEFQRRKAEIALASDALPELECLFLARVHAV
jgi:hypothetical protein